MNKTSGRIAAVTLSFCVFLSIHASIYASGPIPPISEGFGSEGPYPVTMMEIAHPLWNLRKVTIYAPENGTTPAPVILFAHGYTGTNHEYYSHLLKNLASNGYHVIFAPANPLVGIPEQYDMYIQGFATGLEELGNSVDTTRIGFMGHSFGGGFVPRIAWLYLVEKNWGGSGSFLFPMAPWYSYEISEEQIAQFPDNTALVMQIYDSDTINDHRMAIDVYNSVNISDDKKNFLVLYDDTLGGYRYSADHSVPTGESVPGREENALDYYGVLKIADALCAWSFRGDTAGKRVALGAGSPEQTFMGVTAEGDSLRAMKSLSEPVASHPESWYLFPWSGELNPRKELSGCKHPAPAILPVKQSPVYEKFISLNVQFIPGTSFLLNGRRVPDYRAEKNTVLFLTGRIK